MLCGETVFSPRPFEFLGACPEEFYPSSYERELPDLRPCYESTSALFVLIYISMNAF
jgi:hypothetical protein